MSATTTSYNLQGKKESVTDEILLLNPNQTPLLNLVGFAPPATNTTHVWYEDEMFATSTTLTAALTDVATTAKVASIEPFVLNAVAQIDEELVKVTAIDESTKTLTIMRGYAGSTPQAADNGAEIEFQFVEGEEGQDAQKARYKARQRKENYTQIFMDSIEVSGSALSVDQYGVSDLYAYEKAKKQLELALQLEKALITGHKYDNGKVRQMAGLRQFISTNVVSGAGQAVSINMLRDVTKSIFEKGGFANGGNYAFLVPAKQKVAISDLQNDKLRITQGETSRGQKVDMLVTDFGQFPIILNNNLKNDEVVFVDTDRIKIRPLNDRGFTHVEQGIVGDKQAGFIVGEYTLELQQEQAHARIKGLV
ncbi:SU10 major capsid protein [Rummeliibacillus suwonensis]|uniref:SU10 major capsid protein n=1 Tax=Rummeliibacillus suwonensis TaxID=1306154 RepID=UPI0011B3C6A7|nr:DUF5309 family protein [Rummeliibacillus suwonensis]